MILLQASHLAKQYNGHEVLRDASVVVHTGDRVALVGVNGAGKSTLLRILMGELDADVGTVSLAKDVQVGYVAQFIGENRDVSVFEFVAESFAGLYALERQLRRLEAEMAKPDVHQDEDRFAEVSTTYARLQQQFDEQNGYGIEARIRRVLDGLQFPSAMHQQSVQSLSGGQKTRLSLARLLAVEPDVLVLDEPTNYLDTDTLTWLEGYLQNYSGSILVVSHDRYFLDQVANAVVELEGGQTTRYTGNYSTFVETKAAQFESEMKRYEAQQKEIARMEDFVQRNLARATTTKRAQSRRKMLERIDRVEKPSDRTLSMALSFTANRASGKDVLQVEHLQMGYPGKRLPGPLNFRLQRGQRVAILGQNGIGKTTFLKVLTGHMQSLGGEIRFGTHVDVGYYDQEQTHLHDQKTVLQEVWDEYPQMDKTTVRTALGRFLFRGEDVEKPVHSLSGGERSRLSLCLLMLEQANLLIMDEPTNHLDLLSKEVLEDALADYDGTLLFVSHDRYFIDALATHVAVLGGDGFELYIGNYTDYMRKRAELDKWAVEEETTQGPNPATGQRQTSGRPQATDQRGTVEQHQASGQRQSTGQAKSNDGAQTSAVPAGQAEASESAHATGRRHVRSADLRKLRERVEAVESQIAELEHRSERIAEEMTAAAINQEVERTQELQKQLEDIGTDHEQALAEWERLSVELEELESHLP